MSNFKAAFINFYGLGMILIPQCLESVSVTYSIISRGGSAHIYHNNKEVCDSAPQWYVYDIIIGSDKSIRFANPKKEYPTLPQQQTPLGHIDITKGIATSGNYAEIRNIVTPKKFSSIIRLYDKGVQELLEIVIPQGTARWNLNKHVPWDQDGNYFTIQIND